MFGLVVGGGRVMFGEGNGFSIGLESVEVKGGEEVRGREDGGERG